MSFSTTASLGEVRPEPFQELSPVYTALPSPECCVYEENSLMRNSINTSNLYYYYSITSFSHQIKRD